MTTPVIELPGPEQGAATAVTGASAEIVGRSPGQIAWRRLKRDKVAIGGGIFIIVLIVVTLLGPYIIKWLGHPPNEYHLDTLDPTYLTPKGSFGGITKDFLLGVEPNTGRDTFSRIIEGAQVSLTVALLATVVSVAFGVVAGITAGYFGGKIDAAISRLMDGLLAFPVLLFAIALGAVMVGVDKVWFVSGRWLSIAVLVTIIGFFNWPYIGRIIRGQTLSLREKEFVDAARSLGAGPGHIIFKQLLPNLAAPIIVYATLIIPSNITFEASLSFLGVGVQPPTSSWGAMLDTAVNTYSIDPVFMLVPGTALFLTVLAFNLLGDGLRDALDPKAGRQ